MSAGVRFFFLDPPLAEGDWERSCQSGKIVIYHHRSGDMNWVFSNSVVTHTTSITWDPTRLVEEGLAGSSMAWTLWRNPDLASAIVAMNLIAMAQCGEIS